MTEFRKTHFNSWETTECEDCGMDFQVSRTRPRIIIGEVLCGDCEIRNTAYTEGYDKGFKDAMQSRVAYCKDLDK